MWSGVNWRSPQCYDGAACEDGKSSWSSRRPSRDKQEQLGGYFLVNANDLDEAIAMRREFVPQEGTI